MTPTAPSRFARVPRSIVKGPSVHPHAPDVGKKGLPFRQGSGAEAEPGHLRGFRLADGDPLPHLIRHKRECALS